MAKYRQIQISFWQDGFILTLPPEEKYFYIYLMTNSKTTQCGIYELPLKVIEMETGLSPDRIFELLTKFINYRKIKYNEETREIFLLNWLKHNSLKSPKVRSCAVKELHEVKHIPYQTEFVHLSIQYGYPIHRLSIDSGEEEEKEQEEEQEEKENSTLTGHNTHTDLFLKQCNTLRIKVRGAFELDEISAYIGVMESALISEAINRSEGKNGAYVLSILKDWNSKGYSRLDDLKTKVEKQLKTKPQIVYDDPTAEEEERVARAAQRQQERNLGKTGTDGPY